MNSKNYIAILCLLLFTSLQHAAAQVYCTNTTNEPVWIAVAYHETPKVSGSWQPGRWVTEGWLFIWPRDTIQITTHIGHSPDNGLAYEFYYFAYQGVAGGKQWTGHRNFLVELDPKKEINPFRMDFHINKADSLTAYPEYPYLIPFQFKYATGQRSGKFLIVLKQQD